MAARKTSARKKPSRRATPTARARLTRRLAGLEAGLPPTLRDYTGQVRKRLDRLERELTRAQTDVRRRLARLLREASHQLGKLEARGEAGWRSLAGPYRRQLVDLLKRIERVLAPPSRKRSARKAVRKAASAIGAD